ncbi:MutS-related protein [Polaribacter dokdonensis]|uniref:DNA mismatch repair protein MutS n=1 Tax=Polaribacter dokdonensis DSW-5 TaxID=1300348 RepID=A0A0N0CF95_9FLAO|nr:DNA mismatch repair protein MutS [Polaribacter dokdonensis]KOY51464.1 DNA mismatch repair protein MutS [Polaribacter dokdonensis DSW-5]SEE10810.1 MutS domain V [Polaribacter dokdonensis DSW-5]
MQKPIEIYNQQKTELEYKANGLKKKLINLGIFRFVVFLITGVLVYLTSTEYPLVFIIVILGVSLFSILVMKYLNIKREKAIIDKKIELNSIEIDVLNRKFHHLETGKEFEDVTHFYSNDIDLFGKGSFFQYVNRTTTLDGKKEFANLLTSNSIETVTDKQDAINELADKLKWRQHFSALASLFAVKDTSKTIISWVTNYTAVFAAYLAKIQVGFSVVSLVLIGLISLGFLSFTYLTAWFFIGLFITSRFLKKTNKLYLDSGKAKETFKQYHLLLNEIESETFVAKNLVDNQAIIESENKKASTIFKEFSKILDAFDNRNNIIIAVLGNGLFLWDILNACKVEKWIDKYKHTVENWFKVVAYFDARNSLANFKFNHPTFVFPEITSKKEVMKATNLGHPLLKADNRIDNNFNIDDAQFFIVTGANMAGKSTFLRTVSLAIVMANCGLPVCAERFRYHPIKLITSMRTSDSLTDDESYFYSELKRLKFIIDQIKTEKYFIILDEILKGTNSKDKATGSKKFVEKLSKSKSTGIIATHDVSLCELENEFSAIKNYYFDAEIINNELHFDYTLKNGICKNMNASFLLEKMKIV